MSIRIYALAKDLDIESKSLVDLCQKLGMGKCGSALASLTDEEVALVKDHLSKQKAKKTAASAGSNDMARPVPPNHLTSYGKVPNLPARPKKRPDESGVSTPETEPSAPTAAVKAPTTVTSTMAKTPAAATPAVQDSQTSMGAPEASAPAKGVSESKSPAAVAEAESKSKTQAANPAQPVPASGATATTTPAAAKPVETSSRTNPIINIVRRAHSDSDVSGREKLNVPKEPGASAVSTTSAAVAVEPSTPAASPSVSAKPSVSVEKTATESAASASDSDSALNLDSDAKTKNAKLKNVKTQTASEATPETANVSGSQPFVAPTQSSAQPTSPVSPSLSSEVGTADSSSTVSSPVLSSACPVSAGSDSEIVLPYSPVSAVNETTPVTQTRSAGSEVRSDLPKSVKASASAETKQTSASASPVIAPAKGETSAKADPAASNKSAKSASEKSASENIESSAPLQKPAAKPVVKDAAQDAASEAKASLPETSEPVIKESEAKKDSEAPRPKRSGIPVIKVIGHREDPKAKLAAQREAEKQVQEAKNGSNSQYNRMHRDGSRPGPLTMRLAPMPTSKAAAPAESKAKEPAAMKPDIRLSTEVIRATKAGVTPLADHLKRAENQRLEEDKKKAAAAEEESLKSKKSKKSKTTTETYDDSVVKGKGKGKKTADVPVSLGGREQRQLKRKRQGTVVGATPVSGNKKGVGMSDDQQTGQNNTRIKHLHRTGQNTAAPRKNKIVITLPITVRSFAEELGLPVGRLLVKLMQMGQPLVITSPLDLETAEYLAEEFEVDVEIRAAQTLEEKLLVAAEEQEDDPADLKARPPVITFLGHVDHGKTSLLDRIIGINVCSGEKGGITQHIRAYQINKSGSKITFVDTPGHQAFTEMRARGANCTDIAVLVVAADDGVMPQTEEAISHARAAGVPIVVALNKIDIPGVNIPKVMQELSSNDLLPSEWGGDVEVVKCSAVTGEGIDELLDTLLTVAELHEFKANPKRPAMGICVESRLNQEQGAAATVLVQNGTLKVGDIVVCGSSYGRVKALTDTLQKNKRVPKATPSMPVNLFGLDKAPGAGDKFYVLGDISDAREIAARKAEEEHQKDLMGTEAKHVTLENLFDSMGQKNQVQTLNIILRTDVRGSIEAIRAELGKLDNPEVQIRVLQAMVGGITEADVSLADASDAIIIGFNVVPDENARLLAEQKGVQVRRYDIIYKLTDDLRAALEGMLKPEEKETETGRIAVLRKFVISHVGTIAGCRVLTGSIQRSSRVRIIRDNRIIGDYAIDTLKHEKDDVKEALQGHECGIKLQNFNDIKEGDLFEAYKIEAVSRKL